MKYGYFAASLPTLSFGEPAPMTMEAFVAECRRHLTETDLPELEALADGLPEPETPVSAFFTEWRASMVQMRNAIVRNRVPRQPSPADERTYVREHPGYRVWLEEGVQDAFSRSNPLEREQALDRLRWQYAEDLSREDRFGLPAILAYTVQLQIALRWDGLSRDEGNRTLDELLGAVMTTSDEVKGWLATGSM